MEKYKYIIGEDKLSLSDSEFDNWIKTKSKAKPESIKRYYRARDKYIKDKQLEEENLKKGIEINKYIQKDIARSIARTVIIASLKCNILIKRKNNSRAFNQLKKGFFILMDSKEQSSIMLFKVRFRDVVNGVIYTTDVYISTGLWTVGCFEETFNELKYKITSALNKYPDRDFLILSVIIKFFYKRDKEVSQNG